MVGDYMLISTCTLPLNTIATIKPLTRWVRTFRVLECNDPNLYRLDLPSSLQQLYIVINVSQLKPYTGDIISPLYPVTLDRDLKYK